MKKVIVALFSLSVLAVSCKKDENNDCPKTQAEIAGTYKLTKVEVSLGGGSGFTDITNEVFTEPCEADDQIVLNANGTASYVDAGTVCTPNGSDSGTWQLNANGTINMGSGSVGLDLENATIASFDCKNLVVDATVTLMGVSATYRFTFQKQ
jgi:hypothetical protein